MSPSKSNACLTAVKAFGHWLVKDRRLPESPFVHLSRVNQRVDVRIVRRSLELGEVARLVTAADTGKPYRDLTGPDRAVLYLMASFTGLRASELSSLTERSLSFRTEPPTVTLEAACSKHRREDALPLHPDLAETLRQWLQDRHGRKTDKNIIRLEHTADTTQEPGERLFPGTWPEKAAKMIVATSKLLASGGFPKRRQKLKKLTARIRISFALRPQQDVRTTHSLRHTFISNLAGSGVHEKLAKELARHSTITLTMDRYTQVGLVDMNAALESMPGISKHPVNLERPLATGTDPNMIATMVATKPDNRTVSQSLSDATTQTKTARMTGRKSLPDEELSELVITPDEVRAQGLEPWTYGLKVRCSTN